MILQVALAIPMLFAALALPLLALTSGSDRRESLYNLACLLVAAYGITALVLALVHWWMHPDWVHGLWSSVHPQILLAAAAGTFLVRDEWRRQTGAARFGWGPWVVLALLLALASLPAALIQWAPDPDAAPRNVGRPIAGTVEVARFGFGGALPETLVPENKAGEARGMGFLPREVTVPVGSLGTASILWIFLCLVQGTSLLISSPALRRGYLLLAPFIVFGLLAVDMPYGLKTRTLWRCDPELMRAFGPLLLAALAASVLVPLWQWRSRRVQASTQAN